MQQIQFYAIKQEYLSPTLADKHHIVRKAQRIITQSAAFNDVMVVEKTMTELNKELFFNTSELVGQLYKSNLSPKTDKVVLPIFIKDMKDQSLETPNQNSRFILGFEASQYLSLNPPKYLLGYIVSEMKKSQLLMVLEDKKIALNILLNNNLAD